MIAASLILVLLIALCTAVFAFLQPLFRRQHKALEYRMHQLLVEGHKKVYVLRAQTRFVPDFVIAYAEHGQVVLEGATVQGKVLTTALYEPSDIEIYPVDRRSIRIETEAGDRIYAVIGLNMTDFGGLLNKKAGLSDAEAGSLRDELRDDFEALQARQGR